MSGFLGLVEGFILGSDVACAGMELVSTQAHAMTWSESDTVDVYKRLKDHSVITERAQVVTN